MSLLTDVANFDTDLELDLDPDLVAGDLEIDDAEFADSDYGDTEFAATEFSDDDSELTLHPRLGYGHRVPSQSEMADWGDSEITLHPRLGYGRRLPRSGEMPDFQDEMEIIPPDERRFISNTTAVPFRWICALDLYFPDPDSPGVENLYRGTGTLVSPRHVLTCGHNLLDAIEGSKGTSKRVAVRRVVVSPGRNGASSRVRPFGSATSLSTRTSSQWRSSGNSQFDFGLITLRQPIGNRRFAVLGNQPLGYWGSRTRGFGTRITPKDPRTFHNVKVNLCGYPGDKCRARPLVGSATRAQIAACPTESWASTQWNAYDRVSNAHPSAAQRLMFYQMDTFGGHSGSPVWLRWKSFRNLIGIHTGARFRGTPGIFNRGVRITNELMRTVRSWM